MSSFLRECFFFTNSAPPCGAYFFCISFSSSAYSISSSILQSR
nr:MAG TPA: hypothetical protein [Caudoviricetes sp.]